MAHRWPGTPCADDDGAPVVPADLAENRCQHSGALVHPVEIDQLDIGAGLS